MADSEGSNAIWSEHVPPGELAADGTVALLHRYGLTPIVALPPHLQTPQMGDALRELAAAGISIGLWPLLSDADGYWASEHNAEAFAARVDEVLRFAEHNGVQPTTVAIDLEPPLEATARLANGTTRQRLGALRVLRAQARQRTVERAAAIRCFMRLQERLAERDIETLAALFPPVVLDVVSGTSFWESLLATPCSEPGWDRLSPMLYTSVLAGLLPSGRIESARAILSEGTRVLVEGVGPERVAVSLGLVSSGKLGDELHYRGPGELALDVAAARGAGATQLVLYSLDGVLAAEQPEAWLEALATPAEPLPEGIVVGIVRAGGWLSMRLARWGSW